MMVMRMLRFSDGAFSFPFPLLKGNSGCSSDDTLACHGLLSHGNIFPEQVLKTDHRSVLDVNFKQLFLKKWTR